MSDAIVIANRNIFEIKKHMKMFQCYKNGRFDLYFLKFTEHRRERKEVEKPINNKLCVWDDKQANKKETG